MPNCKGTQVENEQLIAAIASPMRPRRCSLGTENVEHDHHVEHVGSLKAQPTVAKRLSFEGARPLKKSRTEDIPSAQISTPRRSTEALVTPASAVSWTPDQRVQLREKIQALLPKVVDSSPSVRSKESMSSPGSSRSSSPDTSRSSSPRTPERTQLFDVSSPPGNEKKEVASPPPPPPPGSPDEGACAPPPPPGSPPSDVRQSPPSSPTIAIRRGCVWPGIQRKKNIESASDIEADIRTLIALHAVSSIFADNVFA